MADVGKTLEKITKGYFEIIQVLKMLWVEFLPSTCLWAQEVIPLILVNCLKAGNKRMTS